MSSVVVMDVAGWPRVTRVIRAVGLGPDFSGAIPINVMAAAQVRGRAVHEAVASVVRGDLDEAALDPRVRPYVDGYRLFAAESGCQALAAEVEVAHPTWRYAGRLDWRGWLRGRRTVLDIKTGAAEGAEYQVAAYVDAWNAQHPGERVVSGGIVVVTDDGRYKYREVDLPAATNVWHAALVVYGARGRRG